MKEEEPGIKPTIKETIESFMEKVGLTGSDEERASRKSFEYRKPTKKYKSPAERRAERSRSGKSRKKNRSRKKSRRCRRGG